jgi:hypothetical protein
MGSKKCVRNFCEEAHESYRLEDRGNKKVDSNANAPDLYTGDIWFEPHPRRLLS